MTDKLKPCPFCGGKAELNLLLGNYCVTCTNCLGAIVPSRGMTGEEAIEAWNARKPIDKVVKQLEELQELGRRNECAGGEAACPVTNCEEHYIQLAIEIVKKGGTE